VQGRRRSGPWSRCSRKYHAGGEAIDSALLQRALDLSLSAETGGPLERLNQRERRIARLVARGMRNRDIGAELGIGEQGTVKVYLHATNQKLGIKNRINRRSSPSTIPAISSPASTRLRGSGPQALGATRVRAPQSLLPYC
jgi:DNA-binding CsgD family transcriptional regulator